MPLPPRWSLGYHQSRWGYSPDSAVLQIAQELRNRHIPADGLWLDIQHMRGFRTFTWDTARFNDPAAMKLFDRDFMHRLEQMGFDRARGASPWDASVPTPYMRPQ